MVPHFRRIPINDFGSIEQQANPCHNTSHPNHASTKVLIISLVETLDFQRLLCIAGNLMVDRLAKVMGSLADIITRNLFTN